MDPLLPGHVLFLSPLPGLVRQLTQLARVDSIRQDAVWLWHISHKDVTTTLRLNVQPATLDLVYKVLFMRIQC